MKRLRINLLKWFEAAQRAGAISDRRKEFIGTMSYPNIEEGARIKIL